MGASSLHGRREDSNGLGPRKGEGIMLRKGLLWGIGVTVLVVLGYGGMSSGAKDSGTQPCIQTGIPAEKVADHVHAVLQADRTFYTTHVVERMEAKGVVVASENWQEKNTLPLPAQFLNESNRLAGIARAGISYRLISLWPINKQSGPKTPFEHTGLQETLQHPDRRYSEVVMIGSDPYLQALYADRAVSQACIGCHNTHPDSPKKNYKVNDVMGGMIITIPLKK
jgi:hypothetical protein